MNHGALVNHTDEPSHMKLLILGGTRFLGRHLVEVAIARDHDITLFNRGQSAPTLFPEVEHLQGDRDGQLDALKRRSWDAVIDTSGYVPRVVKATAEILKDRVDHYTFISTVSVYGDFSQSGIQEDTPVQPLNDPLTEDVAQFYGELKAACEQVLDICFPGNVLHIRPGLIVGPYDPTGRFTYWVQRMAEGGEVLAPDVRQQPVQFIDGRDLAVWIIHQIETQRTGRYNALGPQFPLTFGDLLTVCRTATGTTAQLTWVKPEFLIERGVEPWNDLPLWLPAGIDGFFAVSHHKALQEGLTMRSLTDTVRDTLAWVQSSPSLIPKDPHHVSMFGLERSREQELLQKWHMRSA